MPLLTRRDITVAVFKAAVSQLPGYGPFIAEAVGAMDQRASLDALEARLVRLETILVAGDLSRARIGKQRARGLRSVTFTPDWQKFSRDYAAAKQAPETLETFLVELNESPPAEFFHARPGFRICMLEEILSNRTLMVVTATTVDVSTQLRAGSDGQAFTVRAREALLSATVQELGRVDEEEDCFVLLSTGTDDDGKVHYTYVPEVWRLLGFQFVLNRQFHEAIGCFIRAIELGVFEPEHVLSDIAACFINAGNVVYGIQRLKVLVDANKFDLHARIRLADALDQHGNTAEAEVHYQAFIDEYESRLREIEGYTFGVSSQINYERARIALGQQL